MSKSVSLHSGPPWGFRITGGADVDQNIVVSRVTPGSPAELAGLRSRDILLAINGTILKDASRPEAEALIRTSPSGRLDLIVKLATAWDAKPGRMKAADPTWVAVAKEMEKPRLIGDVGADASLVTSGTTFKSAAQLPTVVPAEHNVLEPRRFLPKVEHQVTCNKCTQPITGEYSFVEGLNFHKDCFVCAAPNCQGNLDSGFIVDGGKAYCVPCHNKYFSEMCLKCNKPIFGEEFRTLNCQWHLECFACTACNQPIYDGVFHLEQGNVYCDADHKKLFSTMCYGCKHVIKAGDNELEAIGQKWHGRCFNCNICRRNLNKQRFITRNKLPICHNCK